MISPETIKQYTEKYFDEIRNMRRTIHQHPELAFEEIKTSQLVAEKLTAYGIPFRNGIAKTGIAGIIEGKNPGKKVVALRADMDALPIEEMNDVSYKSQHAGVMHACGHDVHTACLTGAAKILHALRNDFEGTVKIIFQPSEEKSPGGASIMIQEGVLKNPDVDTIFGQHVFTPLPAGKAGFCFGAMMAASDEIYLRIKGKGGHAAYPHDVKDPVMMMAQLLVTLQQVVSRMHSPFEPIVLSFGKIQANGATNVIPDEVIVEGTLRTMHEEIRMQAHAEIEKISRSVAESLGGKAELEIVKGYPVLYNDKELTAKAFERAAAFLGKENVSELTPRMGAEDFAFYSQQIPACFYRLGTGNPEKGITANIHTPLFNIDEEAIKTGMGLLVCQALGELGN